MSTFDNSRFSLASSHGQLANLKLKKSGSILMAVSNYVIGILELTF